MYFTIPLSFRLERRLVPCEQFPHLHMPGTVQELEYKLPGTIPEPASLRKIDPKVRVTQDEVNQAWAELMKDTQQTGH